MATKIQFTHDGKDYCLEFNRKTVRAMEESGFVASRLFDAPMTMLPDLFAGAFKAHHKFLDRKVIDGLYDKFKNKKALLSTLTKMYNEPINALLGESDEEDEGNMIAWEETN